MENINLKFTFKNTEILFHKSWHNFIISNKDLIDKISVEIGNDFTPEVEKIFLFLLNDLSKVKCIILGQDPYPNEFDATGRAFEVMGYDNWLKPIKNTSLNNILKLVVNGNLDKDNILSVAEIRNKIIKKEINILPPNLLFKHWQDNLGVLLLNTALTCELNIPGSHKDIWNEFTKKVINYIDENNKNIYWYLFGNHAKQYSVNRIIKNGTTITSSHPRINSKNTGDFLSSDFFTTKYLNINWKGI